jgi:hypothetical protein
VCRETAELECETCGFSETRRPEDLNVLNFERFKWGGARPTDPLYAALDLELFAKERPVRATSADREALAEILNRAGALAARAKPGDLDRAIGDAIPGNSPERRTLISILAICGVLEPAGHPSYRRTFVRASTIPEPPGSNNDWDYPAAWWRGSDGVSQAGVKEWFPWLRYRRKRWAR